MKILAFAASQRTDSLNQKLMSLAVDTLRDNADNSVTHLPYTELEAPLYDDSDHHTLDSLPESLQRFVHLLAAHDALVIASPEYNWSMPGHLKNIIDWISCLRPCPFASLPTLLLSATPSHRGGLSGLLQLQTIFSSQETPIYPRFFALAQAHTAFDPSGALSNPVLTQELQGILSGFTTFSNQLDKS